jgi:hypothetical protein
MPQTDVCSEWQGLLDVNKLRGSATLSTAYSHAEIFARKGHHESESATYLVDFALDVPQLRNAALKASSGSVDVTVFTVDFDSMLKSDMITLVLHIPAAQLLASEEDSLGGCSWTLDCIGMSAPLRGFFDIYIYIFGIFVNIMNTHSNDFSV